ncbi:MAG TPA: dienelactone hydrolase family protein [Pyrinomonadaceae bacterium]|jgi:carboxymethylenebutenolidase|nr:dienelactone hydrolase family protein [Pyrinomonadaceae bacterium]
MHEDLIGLLPGDVTRRGFILTSLAAGFALAVQPVVAQSVITTDAQGLEAGEVKIPVRDGEIPGYRAMPAKGGKFPVVLVVQEIFGVHEHIKDICRRFAKLGYMAIAPALYARQGDVSQMKMEDIMKVVARVPDEQVMSDLDSTAAYARGTGKGDAKRLGITGFCWGGRIVWLYAAHSKELDAGVAWYGRLVAAPDSKSNPLTPRQPIELVNELKAPVLGLYGGKDQGIPVATVEQMREALKKSTSQAARESELVVYPDAGHGFNADYRPSYNKEAATDGWQRLQTWFKKHGAA